MYILHVNHYSHRTGLRTATTHKWHTSVNWPDETPLDRSDCCWMVPGTVNSED
jgi:hypothetical protein